MRRRGVLAGTWALATLVATLVAWAAVRQVTDAVSPSTVLPLPSAVALADPISETATPAPSEAPPTTAPDADRGRKPRNRPQPEVVVDPSPADPPPDTQQPAQEPRQDGAAEGEDEDATSPTVTEAYELQGGVVTVRYSGTSTRLVSATPDSGFDVDVHDGGPGKVDVRFRSDDHESRLITRIRDGEPDPQREERPR